MNHTYPLETSSCCTRNSSSSGSNRLQRSTFKIEESSSVSGGDHCSDDNHDGENRVILSYCLRSTNSNPTPIYTVIEGSQVLSEEAERNRRCCSGSRRRRNRNSFIMGFLTVSVWSTIVTGIVVWIRTLFWQQHPTWPDTTTKVQLSFKNRTFKIIQFTDLHYGENPYTTWGPEQDSNTTRLINTILQLEQQNSIDLIIISGDQITGNNINGNATIYYEYLCQLFENHTVPYAFIFGNHDDAIYESPSTIDDENHTATTLYNTTTLRPELMQYITQRTSPNNMSHLSLSQAGPTNINGVSNYVLNVYNYNNNSSISSSGTTNSSSRSSNVVLQIMLLDSGGGSMNEEIVENQLVWYQQQRLLQFGDNNNNSNNNTYVDAIAFQHIPTQQFLYRTTTSTTSDTTTTTIRSSPTNNICSGMNGENGIAPLQNDPNNEIQFLYRNDPTLHFLAVGHNHGNSYCCRNDDSENNTNSASSSSSSTNTSRLVPLHLCFGRHSGYGGYGLWERGARVYELTLHDDDDDNTGYNNQWVTWKSYVRFETGRTTDMYEPF